MPGTLEIRQIEFLGFHLLYPAILHSKFIQHIKDFIVFFLRNTSRNRWHFKSPVHRVILRHQADSYLRRKFFRQPFQYFPAAR